MHVHRERDTVSPWSRRRYEKGGYRRSQLTRFVCGGAGIPPELVRRAHRVMGTAVVRTYGSTELPTLVMGDPFGDIDLQAEDEGAVIGGNEFRLGEDDELLVRGPELFVGYVDSSINEESFTEDGFFRTGDVAAVDGPGQIRITSRIKDIINRGGEKFSAATSSGPSRLIPMWERWRWSGIRTRIWASARALRGSGR